MILVDMSFLPACTARIIPTGQSPSGLFVDAEFLDVMAGLDMSAQPVGLLAPTGPGVAFVVAVADGNRLAGYGTHRTTTTGTSTAFLGCATQAPTGGPTAATDDCTIGREQVVGRQFIIDDGLSDLGDDALSFPILDGICLLLELGDFPVEVDQ